MSDAKDVTHARCQVHLKQGSNFQLRRDDQSTLKKSKKSYTDSTDWRSALKGFIKGQMARKQMADRKRRGRRKGRRCSKSSRSLWKVKCVACKLPRHEEIQMERKF